MMEVVDFAFDPVQLNCNRAASKQPYNAWDGCNLLYMQRASESLDKLSLNHQNKPQLTCGIDSIYTSLIEEAGLIKVIGRRRQIRLLHRNGHDSRDHLRYAPTRQRFSKYQGYLFVNKAKTDMEQTHFDVDTTLDRKDQLHRDARPYLQLSELGILKCSMLCISRIEIWCTMSSLSKMFIVLSAQRVVRSEVFVQPPTPSRQSYALCIPSVWRILHFHANINLICMLPTRTLCFELLSKRLFTYNQCYSMRR